MPETSRDSIIFQVLVHLLQPSPTQGIFLLRNELGLEAETRQEEERGPQEDRRN